MVPLKSCFVSWIILFASIQSISSAITFFDEVFKFGQKINNNDALEKLALEIMPMSTRIKLLSYAKNVYENINDKFTLPNEIAKNKEVSVVYDAIEPLSKNTFNKISDKFYKLKNSVFKSKEMEDKPETQFHEYFTNNV